MPAFSRSLIQVLDYAPFKTDINNNVTQTLDGVFILFSQQIVTYLKNNLTQAQKDELQTWVNVYNEDTCALWHVPVWAENNAAVYCRVPVGIWSDPTAPVPQKVKDYFQDLWS